MTKLERAKLAGSTRFIYVFKEIKTGKIIYVGQTRYLGRRLNEHRDSLKDTTLHTSIYVYMREHQLEFFRDVEIDIVGYTQDIDEASKLESEFIKKYQDTVQNVVSYDTRKYNTDPRLRKIRCIETGDEYWAMKPVMEKYNISRYLLDKAIKNKTKIANLTFEYIE